MNILFTTPILEHPPAGGSQLRIENTIKALHRVSTLYVVSRAGPSVIGGLQAESFYTSLVRKFCYTPSCRGHLKNRYLRKLQRLWGGITGLDLRRDAAYLLACIDEWNIGVVWFGYGNISFPLIQVLRRMRPNLKLVCDTDSVWSRFILRELPYIRNPLRRWLVQWRGHAKEAEERAWIGLCDVTTGVSEVDCDYYRSLTYDKYRVMQFSNVIDLATYAEKLPAPSNLKKPCIYLAGKFGHANSPMDQAARWMLDEVFPIILKKIPNLHFYIVGTGSDKTLGHETNEHITVTGKLPSVLPYLCHADVALVPLFFESGTRFKILEAAACDIPLVSTTLGAEGLPVNHGKHILIADTPQDFADAIIKLVNDRVYALQMADACRALVRGQFSLDTLEKEAGSILNYLTK